MADLVRANEIANEAHEGVLDKCGEPYIYHPRRVRDKVFSQKAKMVAILHDVVEDTGWTLDDLRKEGFEEDVVLGIDGMTRRVDESYMQFIRRLSENDLSVEVKVFDIADNTDLNRIPKGNEDWFYKNREGKYKKALKFLMPQYEKIKEKQDNFSVKKNNLF